MIIDKKQKVKDKALTISKHIITKENNLSAIPKSSAMKTILLSAIKNELPAKILEEIKAKTNLTYDTKKMKLLNTITMPIDYHDEKTLKAIRYRILNLTSYPYYYITLEKSLLPSYLKQGDLVYHLTIVEEFTIEIYKEKKLEAKAKEKLITFSTPENFNGRLESYQKEGVIWMLNRLNQIRGCLLADDMGLGKTIQIIATILYLKNKKIINNTNKAIILVPKALTIQWLKEISRFAPSLNTYSYQPGKVIPECDIIIFSHSQAYINYKIVEELSIYLLVIDEAHRVKTPEARITKCFKKFKYKKVILVTGTPFENSIRDGLCLIDFIYEGFYDNLIDNLEKNTFIWQYFLVITNYLTSSILRRMKNKETLPDLPSLTITNIKCTLDDSQRKTYERYAPLKYDYKAIFNHAGGGPMLGHLKLICNDTSFLKANLDLQNGNSKIAHLLRIYKAIPNDEKLIVISQYTTTLYDIASVLELVGLTNFTLFHGNLSSKQRDDALTIFKQSKKKEILLLSLKAGGVGLNLQEASHVIIYDLWWNRSAEEQAIARVFRSYQLRKVNAYRLILDIALENSIFNFVNEKEKKINLIWQVINNSFKNLTHEEQQTFYSFIFRLHLKFPTKLHTSLKELREAYEDDEDQK